VPATATGPDGLPPPISATAPEPPPSLQAVKAMAHAKTSNAIIDDFLMLFSFLIF
jgi:hypothetical protein